MFLTFSGRGSAFNLKEGNNSAYIKKDENLFLIDCGGLTHERLIQKNVFEGIENIYIAITHRHPDHVSGLGDLIFYAYYVLKADVTILVGDNPVFIKYLLYLQGINEKYYNIMKHPESYQNGFYSIDDMDLYVRFEYTKHCEENPLIDMVLDHTLYNKTFKSYGLTLNYNEKSIYYSGDSNIFVGNPQYYDYIYQDTCGLDYEGNAHLSFKKLIEATENNPEDRKKVYCMHLDKAFDEELAKSYGFNIVEVK